MRIDRLVILTIFLISCKVTVPTSSVSYSEDLSIHRPVAVIELEEKATESEQDQIVNKEFKPLEGHIGMELDSIAKIAYQQNKSGRYIDGYVIQVYSGNSREDANTARTQMYTAFPDLDPKISYHQPSFRVKAGQFIDRLEANRVYSEVKKEFPRALLIPERFLLTYE